MVKTITISDNSEIDISESSLKGKNIMPNRIRVDRKYADHFTLFVTTESIETGHVVTDYYKPKVTPYDKDGINWLQFDKPNQITIIDTLSIRGELSPCQEAIFPVIVELQLPV